MAVMPLVTTELHDKVAVVTLNDPDKRNALNEEMVGDLQVAFDWLERDETNCAVVIVTGAAPAFCAGANLGNLAVATQTSLREIYEGFLRVKASRLPTIAAVNGAAVGAGVNLALCCDLILCGESARIDTRFMKLGLHPGGGHSWLMRERVGLQVTNAMTLFGEVLDGREAERVGFAFRCLPDAELMATAHTYAQRVAAANEQLSERIKRTIQHSVELPDHEQAVTYELMEQMWSLTLPEFQANVAGR